MFSSPDYRAPKTLKEHFYMIIWGFFPQFPGLYFQLHNNQDIVLYLSTMLISVFLVAVVSVVLVDIMSSLVSP